MPIKPFPSIAELQEELRGFADERDWNQFHSPKNLAMALVAEAGELVEHFQWLNQDESRDIDGDRLQAVSEEMADVLIYLARLADVLGVDLLQAGAVKIEKNRGKYPADSVRGQAKKYTEY